MGRSQPQWPGNQYTGVLNPVVHLLLQEESNASLARVKKDAKLMPNLVYVMEGWEKQLVSTGKSANKNLLRDAKRSFCRDFKVKVSADPQGQQQNPAAAAAAGDGGARSRKQGPRARTTQQQQPAGSRGSGASHGRVGGSNASGGQEEGEEEDEQQGDEEEEGDGDQEMGDAATEGGQEGECEEGEGGEEGENEQQWGAQQQKHGGGLAAGKGQAGRAPLQRRQA